MWLQSMYATSTDSGRHYYLLNIQDVEQINGSGDNMATAVKSVFQAYRSSLIDL